MDSKKILLVIVLIIVVGIGYTTLSRSKENEDPISQNTNSVLNSNENETSNIVEITMTAEQWEFKPNEVRVKEGDLVKMTITSLDVDHGYAINELGVSEFIPGGETVTFEFVASKKGTYRHYCNVLCGVGHGSMAGEFIVE